MSLATSHQPHHLTDINPNHPSLLWQQPPVSLPPAKLTLKVRTHTHTQTPSSQRFLNTDMIFPSDQLKSSSNFSCPLYEQAVYNVHYPHKVVPILVRSPLRNCHLLPLPLSLSMLQSQWKRTGAWWGVVVGGKAHIGSSLKWLFSSCSVFSERPHSNNEQQC